MLFLQKRAQRQTVREWAISADAKDTRQDDKVWWCVTQHITAGICGDAASYKYVAQGGHSVYVSESLGPGQLARHRCCMWHRAFARSPEISAKRGCRGTRERCDVNSTPSPIGHYARVSLQLEPCDKILYEVNGLYEVTVGKNAFGS